MTTYSLHLARQLRRHRQRFGADVIHNGRTLRCVSEPVAGQKAGTNALNTETLGVYGASADPRVFYLDPLDFQPETEAAPPREGDTLEWHGLVYRATAVTFDDAGDDTLGIAVYAFRQIV